MKTIVALLDFSPLSYNAANFAANLAKVIHADLHLLYVHIESVPSIVPTFPTVTFQVVPVEEYRVALDKEIEQLTLRFSIKVTGEIVRGWKSDSIKKVAHDRRAFVVCMGHRTTSSKPLLGSSTIRVLQHSSVPVLVIPEKYTYRPIKHVILALDYTEMLHYSTLAPMLDVIKSNDASLRLLHIETPVETLAGDELPNRVHLPNVLSGITYLSENLQADDVLDGLVKYVDEHPADLLVMVPHRHTMISRLFKESNTRAMSFRSPIPILMLSDSSQLQD